jgi:hypothetical protein
MELEGSLPCSQEPSTGRYFEPDRSSPYHPILSKISSYAQYAWGNVVIVKINCFREFGPLSRLSLPEYEE